MSSSLSVSAWNARRSGLPTTCSVAAAAVTSWLGASVKPPAAALENGAAACSARKRGAKSARCAADTAPRRGACDALDEAAVLERVCCDDVSDDTARGCDDEGEPLATHAAARRE